MFNKKIMSVLLAMVIIANLLTGCSVKSTQYFKNMKTMSEPGNGRGTSTINIELKDKDVTKKVPEDFLKKGKLSVTLRVDYVVVDENKFTLDLFFRKGKEKDVTKVLSLEKDNDIVYMSIDKMLELLKTHSNKDTQNIIMKLEQMGIKKNVCFNVKKIAEVMGTNIASGEEVLERRKASKKTTEDIFSKMDKCFGNLTEESKNDYTLNINKQNADKFTDGLDKFMDEYYDEITEKLVEFIEEYFYSEKAKENSKASIRNIEQYLKDFKKTIKNREDGINKALKEDRIDIQTKNSAHNKTTTLFADVAVKDKNYKLKSDFKYITHKGKYNIVENVKNDATDITSTVLMVLSGNTSMFLNPEQATK